MNTKKSKYKHIITIFLFAICTHGTYLKSKNVNPKLTVRVLLDKKHAKETSTFNISTETEMLLSQPHIRKKILVKQKKLKIIVKNNSIYLAIKHKQGKQLKIKKIKYNHVRIQPTKTDKITIGEKTYQGTLDIQIDTKNNTLYLVNRLNINDYLYAVLVSEIYQTWPKEMHKIQAVVSRSYVLHHILQARKNKKKQKPYDIKRSNFNQTYNGHHNYTHVRKAIEETKGLILTYNNTVALTMFDACCGGIIPSKMKYIHFDKAPYLSRHYACNYCKHYNLYRWRKQIPLNVLFNRLKNNHKICNKFNNSGKLQHIIISKKDKAGIINKIKLICTHKHISISAQNFWDSLRDKVKSLNFSLKHSQNNIIIEGKGFGHQVGLCQRGARELVNRNWHFRKILKYYYPHTKFARIQYA
jgi:stage II sporulation protein D